MVKPESLRREMVVQRCRISTPNGIQVLYDVYLLLVELIPETSHSEMAGTKVPYLTPQGIQVEGVNLHGVETVFGGCIRCTW